VINVHAGALPFYRGRNVLNWAIINGETSFGVTCHYVDEGIDTGDIIEQRMLPIGQDDDYAVVLGAAQVACADVLHEALGALALGNVRRRQQNSIHPVGFYCGRRVRGDEILDWNQPASRVHDFIRGIAPPAPGARTWAGATEYAVLRSRQIVDACVYIGTPGEVVGRDGEGIVVKCQDSTLRVQLVARIGADGLAGAPEVPRLKIGTRLARGPGESA
jgi:methionyl-tRNA formyltransferase